MFGIRPPVTLPLPRRPLDTGDQVRRWYENELGWPTVPADPGGPETAATPVRLRAGLRFDVLEVPAEAGRAALRHLAPGSPVAVQGDRMRLLVAAGSAEELPGVLEWLEWGDLALDLAMTGEGGLMDAPAPCEAGRAGKRPLPPVRAEVLQGAATWLRPPSRDARSRPRCRRCRLWGAVGAPPISYVWCTPRRRTATDCG